jgi:hypothetical protein
MGTPISFISGNTGTYSLWTHNRAQVNLNLNEKLSTNYKWWNGVDISSQYLLYSDTYTIGQTTFSNGRPTAWTTPNLNDSSLLNLINTLPERVGRPSYTDLNRALNFLQASGNYFLLKNGYENIVDGSVANFDAGWSTSLNSVTINVVGVRCYSVYNGGLRSANYTVQYSDNGSSWTTAFTGVMSNLSNCGNVSGSGTGSGSYGTHRYWRYVEGSAVVSHHPRCSRIDFIGSDGFVYNLVTYTTDNCSDSGEYIIGTVSKDFSGWVDLSTNVFVAIPYNSPTFTTASQGAMDYDGTDDYSLVGKKTALNIGGNITVEAWFTVQSTFSDNPAIICNGYFSETYPYKFQFNGSSNLIGLFRSPSYKYSAWNYGSLSNVFLNRPVHVAIAADSSSWRIFYNGILQPNSDTSGTGSVSVDNNTNFAIAGQVDSAGTSIVDRLPGLVHIARVYNSALTSEQITQNFNTQKARFGYIDFVQSGLTSCFDSSNYISYPTSGTLVKDLSSWQADFTLYNGTTWGRDYSSGYFTFDGADDYMATSAGSVFYQYTTQLSVSFWLKRNGNIAGGAGGGQSTPNVDDMNLNVWLMHGDVTAMIFYVNNSGSWISLSTGTIPDNTWTHIAATVSSSATKLYVNGILIGSTGGASQITVNPNSYIAWGTDPRYLSGRFLNGSIKNTQVYNRTLSDAEVLQNYQQGVILDGSTAAKAAPSAFYLYQRGVTTNGLYYIQTPSGAVQIYCDFTTKDENGNSGWMHVGTISDDGSASNNPTTMPWGAPMNPPQDCGIWEDTNTLNEGSPTFTGNYKNRVWYSLPFRQLLIKDQGATQRNLLYTRWGQIKDNNNSLSDWFGSLLWDAEGSENSNTAYQNGNVTGLEIVNFGVVDPVLESGNKSILLFKFGEKDGVQDGNKDRSMIAWHRYDAADNVDVPAGLGTFTNRGGTIDYRNIVPAAQRQDFPPSTITGGPYNYSLWVK